MNCPTEIFKDCESNLFWLWQTYLQIHITIIINSNLNLNSDSDRNMFRLQNTSSILKCDMFPCRFYQFSTYIYTYFYKYYLRWWREAHRISAQITLEPGTVSAIFSDCKYIFHFTDRNFMFPTGFSSDSDSALSVSVAYFDLIKNK